MTLLNVSEPWDSLLSFAMYALTALMFIGCWYLLRKMAKHKESSEDSHEQYIRSSMIIGFTTIVYLFGLCIIHFNPMVHLGPKYYDYIIYVVCVCVLSLIIIPYVLIRRGKVKIDGIRYKLDKKNGTAMVLPSNYSGDLVIPSSFINPKDGATYRVTGLDDNAFDDCGKLTSVTIPEGVTSIWMNIYGCKKLTALNIGKGVVDIQICMCYSGKVLESIKVADGNTKFDSRNNCNAIIETATNTLIFGCKNSVIPESVTKIDCAAFNNCSGLTSITIPEGVASIGESAFNGCSDLTTITIPSSMIGIGKMAFCLCNSLKDVYCYATVPPSAADKKFGSKSTTLHVPAASVEVYKATAPWSKFKNIVAIN